MARQLIRLSQQDETFGIVALLLERVHRRDHLLAFKSTTVMLPSLIPGRLSSEFSTNASFFSLAGQLLIPLVSDPMGRGWDLFGTAHVHLDVGVISARFVWHTALVTIVLGHVIAVILAHVQARRIFEDNRSLLMSQIPMLALMVSYTMSSLWMLAQPVVKTQALG